ncbi:MAG TPA: hypothetical protein VFU21_08815 [Kofleriaceae bacterium]|nr:hypothetical protein [Kofleriaceae bacterium]
MAIKRETLRRLASGELAQIAGGGITCCTYERSGCRQQPSGECPTYHCDNSLACEDSCKCL